jgi:hypothetical protein
LSDELKMLVHQADRARCSHASGIGPDSTECNICERRFAGAVFADECVDFTRAHVQVDAVDGDDARKGLADTAQF